MRFGPTRFATTVPLAALVFPMALIASAAPAPQIARVERELLEKAQRNVERHRQGEAVIHVRNTAGGPIAGATVQIRQTGHAFLFGCIGFDLIWAERLEKPELWKQRFSQLFNFAVFPFYWARYEPEPGRTMQRATLEAVAWCAEQGITTKGHPLVWTNKSGLPKWVVELSPDASEEAMLKRVRREVGAYAGRIDMWDVVNEPIHCRAWRNVEARAYIREPIAAVADYVDKAFRAAHAANPEAHLILNEFYTIARETDRERFCDLVVELKRRGTPISGLGIQAHEPREEWFAPAVVWATLERHAELGYPLHITEYIPQSGGKPITGGWREGTWTEQMQAVYAEQFYRLCFGHPSVVSINWWGFTDRRIWLPGGGLLDKDYEPKPVYYRLKDLIHRQWKTTVDTQTDSRGRAGFRGFYGSYDIVVRTPDGTAYRHMAVLKEDLDNTWTVTAP